MITVILPSRRFSSFSSLLILNCDAFAFLNYRPASFPLYHFPNCCHALHFCFSFLVPNTWFLLWYQHTQVVPEKVDLQALEIVASGINIDKDSFCKLKENKAKQKLPKVEKPKSSSKTC